MHTLLCPELIRKGDIALFQASNSLFSRAIKKITKGPSHIAYCLGGFWVAEYVEGTGGRIFDLRAYERAGRHFEIRRDEQLTDRQRSGATRWAKDNCWMGYERTLQFVLWLFPTINSDTPEMMKCSEFVDRCFIEGANVKYFSDPYIPAEKRTPANFAAHPRWAIKMLAV